jgi:hypothetical protein
MQRLASHRERGPATRRTPQRRVRGTRTVRAGHRTDGTRRACRSADESEPFASPSRSSRPISTLREKLAQVATHVRDRMQDLPFPMNADYSAPPSRDPCGLLTCDEAEGVPGKLMVPPYRTANGGPLDRALEIAYRVSSTDTHGALSLAKKALTRLAEAKQ